MSQNMPALRRWDHAVDDREPSPVAPADIDSVHAMPAGTSTSRLGEQGDGARATVAACDGAARFLAYRDRGAEDSNWVRLAEDE